MIKVEHTGLIKGTREIFQSGCPPYEMRALYSMELDRHEAIALGVCLGEHFPSGRKRVHHTHIGRSSGNWSSIAVRLTARGRCFIRHWTYPGSEWSIACERAMIARNERAKGDERFQSFMRRVVA